MVPADQTYAPVVNAKVMPRTALAAVSCPSCGRWHFHYPKPGPVTAPCGGRYRVRIEGDATAQETARIRYALKTIKRGETPTREGD